MPKNAPIKRSTRIDVESLIDSLHAERLAAATK